MKCITEKKITNEMVLREYQRENNEVITVSLLGNIVKILSGPAKESTMSYTTFQTVYCLRWK